MCKCKCKKIQYIQAEDITIIEDKHLNINTINFNGDIAKYINEIKIDETIVIKPYYSGDSKEPFVLVSGLKWLMIAKILGKPIKCLIEE